MPDWTKRPPLDNESTPPHEDEPILPTDSDDVAMSKAFPRDRTYVQDHEPWCNKGYDHEGDCQSGQGLTPEPSSLAGYPPRHIRIDTPLVDHTSIGPVQADERIVVCLHDGRTPDFPGSDDQFADAIKEIAKMPLASLPPVTVRTTGRQYGKGAAMAQEIRWALDPTSRPMVIGLGGYQEHGKDALADILVERHGFMKFGMSDAIHEILMVLDPIISHSVRTYRYSEYVEEHGYTQAKKHPEVRRLLRTLGTEVGRDMIDPDIWVGLAGKKIHAALRNGTSVVLTGIRNGGNEIGLVTLLRGTTIWVDRPGHPVPMTDHRSENTLGPQDFDTVLTNGGTLADLADSADILIDGIQASRRIRGY